MEPGVSSLLMPAVVACTAAATSDAAVADLAA